jgi:hypothetical protein
MATDLTLLNAALTRTGNDPLTSLTSGGAAAAIANANYEFIVKNEISLQPYKKATKIEQLARIDPDVDGDPPEPWTAAYQLPTDLVDIRTVKVAGLPIDYEQHGDTIVCDAAEDDEVILHYVWRVPETWFPPWLAEGIIRRMEAVFLRGLGERYAESKTRDEAAGQQFTLARNRDSQSGPPRDVWVSPMVRARNGS